MSPPHPLIQWGHLKSIGGKNPSLSSSVHKDGQTTTFSQTVLFPCSKARAWQIKTSNTRNWGEKENFLCPGELLWWRNSLSWDLAAPVGTCWRNWVPQGQRLFPEKPKPIFFFSFFFEPVRYWSDLCFSFFWGARDCMDHLSKLGFGKTYCNLLASAMFCGLSLSLWKSGSASAFSISQVTQWSQGCLFDFQKCYQFSHYYFSTLYHVSFLQ